MSVVVKNFDFLEEKGLSRLGRGKVREVFEFFEANGAGKNLILMAATDCVSAFDRILPRSFMPGKGEILTRMSLFWFQETDSVAPNHRHGINGEHWPKNLDAEDERVRNRAIVVRKAKPLPIECVVRGYLAGSAWREYQKTGKIGGRRHRPVYGESDELPEPIFTPTTKAETGHDEDISFDEVARKCGGETAERIRDYSMRLYKHARAFAREKGILIADTKFEFGWDADGELMLIDEALTPDSSRFWLAEKYCPGRHQQSLDKQIVRDYLENSGWDKQSPPPSLPLDVIEKARYRYLEVCEKLTGESSENGY